MKIYALGKKNPNTICLDDKGIQTWYYMTDKVKDVATTMARGTEVEIQTERDSRGKVITSMKQVGVFKPSPVTVVAESHSTASSSAKSSFGKSPDERDSIESQAIGHMVSRTIVGLAGTVDINNVLGIIDTLYKKYGEKIETHKQMLLQKRPM